MAPALQARPTCAPSEMGRPRKKSCKPLFITFARMDGIYERTHNIMPGKTVVITGAAGFLGSHLADALLDKGHRVIGIDNLSRGSMENLSRAVAHKDFEFHQEDVCDLRALLHCVDEASAVAHLAAFKIPRYGKAIDTLTINSQGTLNALE